MRHIRISLYDKVLSPDYYPSRHQLVGDVNMLNGRRLRYERKELEVPKHLKMAYNKSMKMLNGGGLDLNSDPAGKRKKSDEKRNK